MDNNVVVYFYCMMLFILKLLLFCNAKTKTYYLTRDCKMPPRSNHPSLSAKDDMLKLSIELGGAVIYSHNHDLSGDSYPENFSCEVLLHAGGVNKVLMSIKQFYVPAPPLVCQNALYVFDSNTYLTKGMLDAGGENGLCNKTEPRSFSTTTSYMTFIFTTAESSHYMDNKELTPGFQLIVSAVLPVVDGECQKYSGLPPVNLDPPDQVASFMCSTGDYCISPALRCDQVENCLDNSDEYFSSHLSCDQDSSGSFLSAVFSLGVNASIGVVAGSIIFFIIMIVVIIYCCHRCCYKSKSAVSFHRHAVANTTAVDTTCPSSGGALSLAFSAQQTHPHDVMPLPHHKQNTYMPLLPNNNNQHLCQQQSHVRLMHSTSNPVVSINNTNSNNNGNSNNINGGCHGNAPQQKHSSISQQQRVMRSSADSGTNAVACNYYYVPNLPDIARVVHPYTQMSETAESISSSYNNQPYHHPYSHSPLSSYAESQWLSNRSGCSEHLSYNAAPLNNSSVHSFNTTNQQTTPNHKAQPASPKQIPSIHNGNQASASPSCGVASSCRPESSYNQHLHTPTSSRSAKSGRSSGRSGALRYSNHFSSVPPATLQEKIEYPVQL